MVGALGTTVTVLKTLILVTGGLITWYAYRAFRRTGSAALGALAAGFALVTLGALLAGIVDRVLPLSRTVALLVESGFTTCGFAVVLYSLVRE
ncbi:MAG: hypothetical protein ABEH66_02060 [Halobacteriales archaeon]